MLSYYLLNSFSNGIMYNFFLPYFMHAVLLVNMLNLAIAKVCLVVLPLVLAEYAV